MRVTLVTKTAALFLIFLAAAAAQVKPPESASKVKKVLLYNKIGGWVHVDGRRDLTEAVTNLGKSKRFQLQVLEDDVALTPDYLKQFSLLIWDNNVDGAASVPSASARKAVIDYVNAGGGWLLVHGAGDHHDNWAELRSALGTTFTTHGGQGKADANQDAEAGKHRELKWMVQGWPAKVRLHDEWYSFQNTVRKLPGVTVVYTAANGEDGVLLPVADGSNDHVYLWARELGKGRMFYSAIGHGGNDLYAQADSFVTRALWQEMRYAAGDFQNGCTNPNAPNFDAQARVDDGSCRTSGVGPALAGGATLALSFRGRTLPFAFPHAGDFTVELRDPKGNLAWAARAGAGETPIAIGAEVAPGIYWALAKSGRSVARARVVLY